MHNTLAKMRNRIASNRADANSTSQILWIAVAAAVALVIGGALFQALKAKGTEVSTQIADTKNVYK